MDILPLSHPEPIGKLPPHTLNELGEELGPGYHAITLEDGHPYEPTPKTNQVLGILSPLTDMIMCSEERVEALQVEFINSYVAPGDRQRSGGWHKDHDVLKRKTTYIVANAFPTEFLVRPMIMHTVLERIRTLSASSNVDTEELTTATPRHGLRVIQPLPDVVTRFKSSWHRSPKNTSDVDTLRLWIRAIVNPD